MSVPGWLEGLQRWLVQRENKIKMVSSLVFLLLVLLVVVIALPTNGPAGARYKGEMRTSVHSTPEPVKLVQFVGMY